MIIEFLNSLNAALTPQILQLLAGIAMWTWLILVAILIFFNVRKKMKLDHEWEMEYGSCVKDKSDVGT